MDQDKLFLINHGKQIETIKSVIGIILAIIFIGLFVR